MVVLKCSDYATFLNFIALSKSYVACKFIQILADVFKASAKSKADSATKMKSVLVTGGAGYIGSHTVAQLKLEGYSPIVVDNLSNGFKEALPENSLFYQIDVRHKAELAKVFAQHNISAVIHLAGLAIVEESFEKSLEYLDQNVNGTRETCSNSAKNSESKILFSPHLPQFTVMPMKCRN